MVGGGECASARTDGEYCAINVALVTCHTALTVTGVTAAFMLTDEGGRKRRGVENEARHGIYEISRG